MPSERVSLATLRCTTSRTEALVQVETWARDLLEARPASAHGWLHVDRVRRLVVVIAQAEGVDPWLAACAALIHDVGRIVPGPESEHGLRSSELAAPLLAGLPLTEAERQEVSYAVRWHNSLRADTPLLCVLRDADMLDGMGAIGVMRACMSKGMLPAYDVEAPFDKPYRRPPQSVADQVQFQMAWVDNLNTETGRRLARQRLAFMRAFTDQVRQELQQND
jgi:uncharacterized protein